MNKKALVTSVFTIVVVSDYLTKRWALRALGGGDSYELLGGLVPITLAYNRGAAFGLSFGQDPRWFFVPITLVAIVVLLFLIREAARVDWLRVVSATLVLGGACGNLYDRLRWDRGVVDFIGPIDLGVMLWPIFNVADSAITCGAVLLGISFWREEARLSREDLRDSGSRIGTEGEAPSPSADH